MKFHKIIASVFGIGYIGKGGGTIAAIFYGCIWLLLPESFCKSYLQLLIALFITALGIWNSNNVDSIWGKDSSKVVVDEVAGMAITLLYLPQHIEFMIVGLVAFRFFDIVKPLGIKKLENLPRGWGVMADDVLAGIYALIIVQLGLQLKLFLK